MSVWLAFVFTLVSACSVCATDALQEKNHVGVVGGEETRIEDFPYMVSLRLLDKHICGATIIHQQFILTAAHCLVIKLPFVLSVLAGTANITQGGERYRVEKIIEHPQYTQGRDYDVGVVKLKKKLELSEKVAIAKLATTTQDYQDGTVFNVTGWGFTTFEGTPSQLLLRSEVPWIDQSTCKKDYADTFEVNDHMLCAGGEAHDACQGDSGGPLSLKDEVVGVVSGGRECALKDYPTIYMRVSHFIDWIQETIKNS